jgi:hypothetical protein
MDDNQKLIEVKRQVGAIKKFYVHLSIFVMVMTMLTVINLASGHSWWVQWPLLGWGIGLLAHALRTYGPDRRLGWPSGWLGPDWEQRKVERLMAKK